MLGKTCTQVIQWTLLSQVLGVSAYRFWIRVSYYFVDGTSLFLNINTGQNREEGNMKEVRNQQH